MKRAVILKDEKHSHFWTQDGELCESYYTIRGMRFRFITNVDYPDCENLTDAQITEIKLILEK